MKVPSKGNKRGPVPNHNQHDYLAVHGEPCTAVTRMALHGSGDERQPSEECPAIVDEGDVDEAHSKTRLFRSARIKCQG